MKLLAFGEVLWDVYPDRKYIGGAPLNFAAHFKNCGGKSAIASCVGNDALGKETLDAVGKFGVETDFISVSGEKPTGRCNVTLNESLVPAYDLKQDVAYDYIPADKVRGNFDVLYFGTLALRSAFNMASLTKLIKANDFKEVFVDVNIRAPFFSSETVLFALNNATILKISDEELPTVAHICGIAVRDAEGFSKALHNRFPKIRIITVTLGEKGAFAYDCRAGLSFFCPAQKVKVVSTVGAGDSFGAAFLYNYLCGKDIEGCLSAAVKLSGYVVTRKEAIT